MTVVTHLAVKASVLVDRFHCHVFISNQIARQDGLQLVATESSLKDGRLILITLHTLKNKRGVGATETETICHRSLDAGVVDACRNERHALDRRV